MKTLKYSILLVCSVTMGCWKSPEVISVAQEPKTEAVHGDQPVAAPKVRVQNKSKELSKQFTESIPESYTALTEVTLVEESRFSRQGSIAEIVNVRLINPTGFPVTFTGDSEASPWYRIQKLKESGWVEHKVGWFCGTEVRRCIIYPGHSSVIRVSVVDPKMFPIRVGVGYSHLPGQPQKLVWSSTVSGPSVSVDARKQAVANLPIDFDAPSSIPTMRRFAAKVRFDQDNPTTVIRSLHGLGAFADPKSYDILTRTYEKATNANLRNQAAQAIVAYGQYANSTILLEIANDSRLPLYCTLKAAAELMSRHNSVAREMLQDHCSTHFEQLLEKRAKHTHASAVHYAMRLSDRPFEDWLSRQQPDFAGTKVERLIETMLWRMKLNTAATAEVRSWVLSPLWSSAKRRYAAIEILSECGTAEDVDLLSQQETWVADNGKVPKAQPDVLKDRARDAAIRLKKRLWRKVQI